MGVLAKLLIFKFMGSKTPEFLYGLLSDDRSSTWLASRPNLNLFHEFKLNSNTSPKIYAPILNLDVLATFSSFVFRGFKLKFQAYEHLMKMIEISVDNTIDPEVFQYGYVGNVSKVYAWERL